MTARIRTWSSRNLSFAARVVLINSVLLAILAYWCQVFILPKKVIRRLESICKAFLWKGQACATGPGLIAWESLCQPKASGGLGFRKIREWNQAAMGKYIWAVAQKQDSLWLKWISSVYLKDQEWWSYKAPAHGSWYWRSLVNLKDLFKKLAGPGTADNISTLTRWIGRSKMSKFKKNFFVVALVCLIYNLWKVQNLSLWEMTKMNAEKLIEGVKKEVLNRTAAVWPKNVSTEDTNWFQHL
ncbi:hypothetical protein CsatA_022862 [Cannabis sativa]